LILRFQSAIGNHLHYTRTKIKRQIKNRAGVKQFYSLTSLFLLFAFGLSAKLMPRVFNDLIDDFTKSDFKSFYNMGI
jgi:hypothetical protein